MRKRQNMRRARYLLSVNQLDGSMRDALSLLDQALAYEDYELSENNVIDMLGLIDNKYALSIVQSILNQDSELLKEQLDGLDSKDPIVNDVSDNIASIAQEIAYLQVLDASKVDVQDEIIELSNNHSPELIQLIYQIAINSKNLLRLPVPEKDSQWPYQNVCFSTI